MEKTEENRKNDRDEGGNEAERKDPARSTGS